MITHKQAAGGPWKITGVIYRDSYHNDDMYQINFVNEQLQEAYTYVAPENRNFKQWKEIIDKHAQGYSINVDNLEYKTKYNQIVRHNSNKKPLIDADSIPKIVAEAINTEARQVYQSRLAYNIKKEQALSTELGLQKVKGKWDLSPYEAHRKDFEISAGDDAETMRTKLKVKGLLKYAEELNAGFHKE